MCTTLTLRMPSEFCHCISLHTTQKNPVSSPHQCEKIFFGIFETYYFSIHSSHIQKETHTHTQTLIITSFKGKIPSHSLSAFVRTSRPMMMIVIQSKLFYACMCTCCVHLHTSHVFCCCIMLCTIILRACARVRTTQRGGGGAWLVSIEVRVAPLVLV